MQKFIELGTGYGDLFELEALIDYNAERIDKGIFLTYDSTASFILIMKPVRGNFQAIYTIYNGIYNESHIQESQKYKLIHEWCHSHSINVINFETRAPNSFYERDQYFKYLIGVLRLNHLLPPLT